MEEFDPDEPPKPAHRFEWYYRELEQQQAEAAAYQPELYADDAEECAAREETRARLQPLFRSADILESWGKRLVLIGILALAVSVACIPGSKKEGSPKQPPKDANPPAQKSKLEAPSPYVRTNKD
jgi:hypothetical protein